MVRERLGDWRLAWRFVLAGLLAGALVLIVSTSGALNGPFFAAQDQLFPAPAPDKSVTFIALDQASLTAVGKTVSNADHARVINYLASLHPKVILIDLPLDRSSGDDPELLPRHVSLDAPLTQAIKAAGNVVLVCTADVSPLPMFSVVAAGIGDRGFANPDDANNVRGVVLRPDPTATCNENEADEPAFLQALRLAEGINDPLVVNGAEATFGAHHIPLVGNQMLINFTRGGGPSCFYQDAENSSCPHPELITGHIVIIGSKLIDGGDVYSQAVGFAHDKSFCPTSRPRCMLDNQNYGYRIMGDAMTTILSDRYVRVQPPSSILLAIVVLSLLVALIVYVLSFRVAVIFTVALLIAYFAAIFVLGKSGYLADPLYAPIAIVLSAAFSMAARYVLEDRERRKVERIFGHYVDPRIVKQLAATHSIGEIISRGERRDLTLLFVDIRGFTSMSEAMDAEDVLSVIQHYLDDISALILKWDGTIDKYVGDEVVALWNAPATQPDHALLALRCAYDLIAQASSLQAKLVEHGLPPVSWGIGINTGAAVVGNMGSKDRLQYTALGDTVNTAARFCSAAPAFTILVGWPTFEACSQYIAVDEMPGVQLKGKSAEKFRVMRVSAIREHPEAQWVQIPTEAALESYETFKNRYAKQSIFATAQPTET